jgi:hypothetical protein
MKKELFLMFTLFLIVSGTANLSAQVRIGGSGVPHTAAVLDLNVTDDATPSSNKGALALPRVNLTSETHDLNGEPPINGMLVYNTGTDVAGAGVYVWITDKWCKALTVAYTGSTSIKLVDGSFQREALEGDVTADANSNATTIAADKVTSAHIKDGEVKTDDLVDGAVTAAKLDAMNASAGQVLGYNGTAWAPSTLFNTDIMGFLRTAEFTVVMKGAFTGPMPSSYVTGLHGDFSSTWAPAGFTRQDSSLIWSPSLQGNRYDALATCTGYWRLPNVRELHEYYVKVIYPNYKDHGVYPWHAKYFARAGINDIHMQYISINLETAESQWVYNTRTGARQTVAIDRGASYRCVRTWP